jgi:hypothetical protein
MAKKALLTWNIRVDSEREHFSRVREFVAKLPSLGLELQDAWYTVYGTAPQVLLGIVEDNKHKGTLQKILTSDQWEQLLGDLKPYIIGYAQRIVEGAGRFHI